MTIKSAILAAAIGAMGFATPAYAGPASLPAPAERVGYRDLNLTTAEGQAELQKRVDSAAWRVCKFDQNGTLRNGVAQHMCYREARQKVAVQVAQTISNRSLLGG